ncbi:MAG TPA: cytochrome P450 [Roseiarcus sp.]|jgi:cytochrome P450
MSLATTSTPFRPPSPTPRATPVGAVGTLYALWRNPLEIWTRAHFEQPVLVGRTVMGMRAVVSDPPAVRRVFLDNAANYRKDALQMRVLRPGLGAGLLTAEGETWRVQRRALAPLFSPRQVADFAPAMHRVGRAATERYLARREARISDVSVDMARVTLEVLEQTLFSQGLSRGAAAFQQAVTRYFETFGRLDPLDVIGAPQFLPRFWRLRGRSTLQFFEKAVDDIIAARKRLIETGASAPEDLLTLLLRAQDPQTGRAISQEDVRANIVTFIGAGHETTANALTWSLYLLSQSPQWRARAEAEVDARFDQEFQGDLGESMPVVKAILEEALRLYPPAAFLSREAIAEDWLAGARIPAGTVVTVAPYVLHRHRRLWSDPDAFDPSRFLGENRERIDRYAYLPFGAGSRVCIGMSFALQEAVIVLAHLISALRFDLVPGHVVAPVQRVTLRSRFGMRMIVRRRGKPA